MGIYSAKILTLFSTKKFIPEGVLKMGEEKQIALIYP